MTYKIILAQIVIISLLILSVVFLFLKKVETNAHERYLKVHFGTLEKVYKNIKPSLDNSYLEYKNQVAEELKRIEEEKNKPKFVKVSKVNIPIMMYHHIHPEFVKSSDALLAGLSVSPKKFEEDLNEIVKAGYTTIFPQEIFKVLNGELDPSKKYIVISIDDGYQDNYDYAFPILKKLNQKAIIYVIPNRVGTQTDGNSYFAWNLAKEMRESGHVEIGSHTMDHADLKSLNEEKQRYQIIESKKIIDEKLEMNTKDFCYPYGRYNETSIKLVQEAGFENATTTVYGQFRQIDNKFEWSRFRGSEYSNIKNFF